jgi:putative membrane protein
MEPQRSAEGSRHLAAQIIGGLAGGLVASFAMDRFQQALSRLSKNIGPAEPKRRPEPEPATYKAADAVSRAVTGQNVPRSYKPTAGAAVHYAFGGAVGAMYGAAAANTPDVAAWRGLPFGATVWLIADEAGVPLAGLSKPPAEYPFATHLSAFATHLVYGVTTDAVRRAVVRALTRRRR